MSGLKMDNHEEILDALTAFGKSPNPQDIPSVLEQYLNSVAKNGETIFPWAQLKPLILRKMELVILELRRGLASETIPNRPNVENVRFDVIHARIIDSLHKFNGAPFTIQRLCELLMDPKRHYKRSDKFMRGLEKNVLVVSTVDPFGRKVVCESGNKPILNGIMDINGSYPPRDTALSIPLPPVPGWVTTTTPLTTASTGPSWTRTTTVPTIESNKPGSAVENLSKTTDVASNSESGGLPVAGPVFPDHGDPLAVHSEEVVEETVVTMDTSEVNSVDTDGGGEAMADRESMEADMADDREEASSFSSSSSSSSEELSTSSDSVETGLRPSPFVPATSSFSEEPVAMDETRPWAAFAQDVKRHEDITTSQPSSANPQDGPPDGVETTSSVPLTSSVSPPSTTSPEESSSSSSLSSSVSPGVSQSTSTTTLMDDDSNTGSQELPNQSNSSQQASCLPSTSCDAVNESTGFEPDNSVTDSVVSELEVTVSDQEKPTSPTAATTTAVTVDCTTSSSDPNITSSSDSVLTYAQVVASSTDKALPLSPYDSTEPVPCDSVAGLERLVGSMEQSLSSSSSPSSSQTLNHHCTSSLSSSSSSSHSLVATSVSSSPATTSLSLKSAISSSHEVLPSSSPCSSSEGEPVSKRQRLSVEEDNMEEEEDTGISTSGKVCMEEGEEDLESQKESSSVDSSSMRGETEEQKRVEGDESEREADATKCPEVVEKKQNEEESSSRVTLDSTDSLPPGEERKVNECDSVDSATNVDTCDRKEECMDEVVDNNKNDSGNSDVESSAVSTTAEGDEKSLQSIANDL